MVSGFSGFKFEDVVVLGFGPEALVSDFSLVQLQRQPVLWIV